MSSPSGFSESRDKEASLLSPSELAELERLWAGKSDEALEEVAHNILDYTEEGQRVIRAELRRRSIPVPAPESQEEEEEEGAGGQFLTPISGRTGERVYSAPVLANVTIFKDALESAGIACEIRRAHLGGAAGELPPGETWPELWILDASMVEQAREIIEGPLEPVEVLASWTCPRCGEDVDGVFSECWNCGSERPHKSAG